MLNKNEISNLGLGRLGVSMSVSDIDTENSLQAKVIRRHLSMSLSTVLEAHDWGFASKRSALALVTEYATLTDGGGWSYLYSLPADCQVLREISRDGIFSRTNQYEDQIEKWEEIYDATGPRIVTDVPNANGRYTVKLDIDGQFPIHFARAVAAQLSMDIAPSLITNNYSKVKNDLNASAKNEISLAIAADIGRQPARENSMSPFIRVRGV